MISLCLRYQILFYIIYNNNIYNIKFEKSTSDSINIISEKIVILKREEQTGVFLISLRISLTTVFVVKKNITFNLGSKSLSTNLSAL